MKQLILGEMKKIFSQKFVLCVVGILLLVNIFNAYKSIVNSSDYWEIEKAYNGLYDLAQGEITQESVGRITSYRDKMEEAEKTGEKVETFFANPSTDLLHVKNIIQELSDIYNYNSKIKQLKENIENQRDILKEKNNIYLTRVNEKIDKTYSQRNITHFYNSMGFASYFDYDFSTFLVLLIVLLACSPVFSSEKENSMSALMLSTVNGRTKLSYAKKLACAIFIMVISLIFFVSDYIVFHFTTSMKGLSLPLYALDSYSYTPLTISIGSFVFLTIFIKIIGLFYIGLTVCTLSSVINKSYVVFGASLAVSLVLMFIGSYSNNCYEFINLINPIKLLTGRNMFKSFDVVNIFNLPFDRYYVTVILSLTAMFAVSFSITALNRKGRKRRSKYELD